MLDRLESAFAGQRRFLDDAGHELRTPITIVRGHLELMGDDPQERRETLALVTDELERMSRLVDDVLTLAKAEQPDFLDLETVDVETLSREVFAKAAALAERDWQLGAVGRGMIVADRQRLTQALVQLAQNAVQHTAEGDSIALSSSVTEGRARFSVRDWGPGVSAAERERIFERFGRGTAARREGAGLGLAIVRAIAEAHGGGVELESRPGEGARFTLELPLDPPRGRPPARGARMSSVLIVEDEERIASFVEKGLRANGFATVVAGDGMSGLALASTGRFDLVILDLGLPDLDGLALLRRLRERASQVPVIILTARDGVRATVEGLEGGADDYVTKPFRFEELLARVRARLRGDRSDEPTVLRAGDASLDLRTRRAQVGGRSVELTAREFALAEMLFRHRGQVLSREQLLDHVWGYDHDPRSNVVDVYVGYLRRKLGKDLIQSVRGMGYCLGRDLG